MFCLFTLDSLLLIALDISFFLFLVFTLGWFSGAGFGSITAVVESCVRSVGVIVAGVGVESKPGGGVNKGVAPGLVTGIQD